MNSSASITFPSIVNVKFYPYRRALVRDILMDVEIRNPDDHSNLTDKTLRFVNELFEMANAQKDNHVCFEAKMEFSDKPVYFMWSDWHFYIGMSIEVRGW